MTHFSCSVRAVLIWSLPRRLGFSKSGEMPFGNWVLGEDFLMIACMLFTSSSVLSTTDTQGSAPATVPGIPNEVLVAALATVIASAIASLVAWLVCRRSMRAQERAELRGVVLELIRTTIQYPRLEDDGYCKSWTPERDSEDDLRYENYCCLVFNLLEDMWRHFRGKARKIEAFFGVREMVQRHQAWWCSPENGPAIAGGYTDPKFRSFIDSYLQRGSQDK